jgi:hypothetical protein
MARKSSLGFTISVGLLVIGGKLGHVELGSAAGRDGGQSPLRLLKHRQHIPVRSLTYSTSVSMLTDAHCLDEGNSHGSTVVPYGIDMDTVIFKF